MPDSLSYPPRRAARTTAERRGSVARTPQPHRVDGRQAARRPSFIDRMLVQQHLQLIQFGAKPQGVVALRQQRIDALRHHRIRAEQFPRVAVAKLRVGAQRRDEFAEAALGLPAQAESFAPVTDKSTFLKLVQDRALRHGLLDLTLNVTPDGTIKGRAMGWEVTGSWHWKDGYFCREMDWEGYAIPYNCQLVETNDGRIVRFTVDRGTGDSAQFRLR